MKRIITIQWLLLLNLFVLPSALKCSEAILNSQHIECSLTTSRADFELNKDTTELSSSCKITDKERKKMSFLTDIFSYTNEENPDELIFVFNLPCESRTRLEICDELGNIIYTVFDNTRKPGMYESKCEVSRLKSGIYYRFVTKNGVLRKSLQIKNNLVVENLK